MALLFPIWFMACVVVLPCYASWISTASVKLAWNPSISTNVIGYNIYYGIASGVYNSTIYVAGSTSTDATVTGLVQGTTYYFAATAVDSLGDESPFSNETSYLVPTNSIAGSLAAATLVTGTPPSNGQFSLTVKGVTGYTYVVQVSANLVNWSSVLTNIAPFIFVDTNASQFNQRFYRAIYFP